MICDGNDIQPDDGCHADQYWQVSCHRHRMGTDMNEYADRKIGRASEFSFFGFQMLPDSQSCIKDGHGRGKNSNPLHGGLALVAASKAVPSARIMHPQSVKVDTARVFMLAITVTQAHFFRGAAHGNTEKIAAKGLADWGICIITAFTRVKISLSISS